MYKRQSFGGGSAPSPGNWAAFAASSAGSLDMTVETISSVPNLECTQTTLYAIRNLELQFILFAFDNLMYACAIFRTSVNIDLGVV